MNKYILLLLFVCDITFTYFVAKRYKLLFPKRDYTAIELNPLIKHCWKRFGLKQGTIISGLLFSIVLIALIQFLSDSGAIFALGVYSVIFALHIHSWRLLKCQQSLKT